MRIIIALIILSIVIFIHELGHFLLAKASHIVVEEFSLGMGPRLFSFGKGETKYSLRIFPIGGSCAMKGEDEDDHSPGSFQSASVWRRMLVILAGPFFNFLLAFVAAWIIIGSVGIDPAAVTEVTEDTAAYKAGLREGDVILKYNGNTIANGRELYTITQLYGIPMDRIDLTVRSGNEKKKISYAPDITSRYMAGYYYTPDSESAEITGIIEGSAMEAAGLQTGDVITSVNGTEIKTGADLEKYWEEHPMDGSTLTFTYRRMGIPYTAEVTPVMSNSASGGFSYNLVREKVGLGGTIRSSFTEMESWIRITLKSLWSLIRGQFSVRDLSGPVGIVSAIGDVYEEAKEEGGIGDVLLNMLNMIILISANLGVMNLLPFPALDGGRFVFLVVEAIRRKPVSQRVEGIVHYTGFILLMILAVFVAVNDVIRLIH